MLEAIRPKAICPRRSAQDNLPDWHRVRYKVQRARRTTGPMPETKPHRKRARRSKRSKRKPSSSRVRSFVAGLRRIPGELRVVIACIVLATLAVSGNWLYQVMRKPTELFFPVSGVLHKYPAATWSAYAPLFRQHATDTLTPDFLAALAQVEASGNPVARTYWRFSFTPSPLEIWRPASSAVGMYQITDGTFELARRFCIKNHRVAREGPWYDWKSCWFNALYARVLPSHAIEMTAAWLDHQVRAILDERNLRQVSRAQRQRLAAVIHLCGAGAARRYADNGLRFAPGQRCGDHDPNAYVDRVARMQAVFRALP